MRIVGIGGAVIKTAWEEIKEVTRRGWVDVLIHNGGSLFHDFQRATDSTLKETDEHSYSLHDLLENMDVNKKASELVWTWVKKEMKAPEGSLTRILEDQNKDILMFTVLGADFWHLYSSDWTPLAVQMQDDFRCLCGKIRQEPFHFVCMGSAVVMPEVFTKALAVVRPKEFKADVVDFLEDMYRPKTRVSKYGEYYKMEHKKFLTKVLSREIFWI